VQTTGSSSTGGGAESSTSCPSPHPGIATTSIATAAARIDRGPRWKPTSIDPTPTPHDDGYTGRQEDGARRPAADGLRDADSQLRTQSHELSRKVLGGTALTTAGLVLSRTLTLLVYLVLARLAAPEVFGVFAAGSILVGIGSMLVESGMLAALIQRRDRLEEAVQTAFVATILGGVAASLVALATAPLVGLVFEDRQIGEVAAAMSGLLVLNAGAVVPDAILQRNFSFLRRVVVDPLGVVAFGITSIAALSAGAGVWGLVLATYASQLTQVVAAWVASRFRPRLRLASFGMWRELAAFGRHVLAGSVIDHLALAANTIVLGRVLSPAALGQYRFAARFAILPQEVSITAGSYVLLPALARVAHEHSRLERGVVRALELLLVVVVPVSLLLVPLGVPLTVLLLGKEWEPAGAVLAVLVLASAPRAVGSVAAEGLKAAGRPDVLPPLHLFQAVTSVLLMVLLVPFGLVGVAAGVAAASILADAAALVRAIRVLRFDPDRVSAVIWPPYAAGVLMAALVFAVDRLVLDAASHGGAEGLLVLAAESLLGLGVYVVLLISLSRAAARDLLASLSAARGLVRSRLATD
jgi:PST family polysaccharide transporter